MKVIEFVQKFQQDKIQNTKINPNAVSEYLKNVLEIKTYIPFNQKRQAIEVIVKKNIVEVNGVKKNDSINQYLSFVVTTILLHTNLEFSEDVVSDYDALAENGLLPQIIDEFKESYNECDVLLKMALADELEDNNVNMVFGRFLNSILEKLDAAGASIKSAIDGVDLTSLLQDSIKQEDLKKLSDFLNTYNK